MAKTKVAVSPKSKAAVEREMTLNAQQAQLKELDLISNAIYSRGQFMEKLLDPRRSINDECGFPVTERILLADYRELYDREAVANRVVEVLPAESWQVQPTVFENEDVEVTTPFEKAWKELNATLTGATWYKTEEGNPIWEYLQRADKLSGVGHYGVLLIGIDDGKELKEPVEGIDELGRATGSKTAKKKLLFLRAFDESSATIKSLEVDKTNPRYGQPTIYSISFQSVNEQVQMPNVPSGPQLSTEDVHWTRVIHVADNLDSSEVWGIPRQRPVWNNLLGLRKLYGGSPEMYWRGAFPGFSLETHPQLGGDVKIDKAAMKGQLENYMNGLQRYLALMGMSAKSLAPQVVDPTPQIDAQIQAICIQIATPKRVFAGSERGELASSQDDSTWNDRLSYRQVYYLTPRIIVPFTDRLIMMQVLPLPSDGYNVVWPDLESLSAEVQATIAAARTEALAKYVQGDVEAIISPGDFLIRELHYSQDEAEEILEGATPKEDLIEYSAQAAGAVTAATVAATPDKPDKQSATEKKTPKKPTKKKKKE